MSLENDRPLWVIHIGFHDEIAMRAVKEGFVCIGWPEMGDLSRFPTREDMRAAMEDSYPNWKPKKVSSSYGQTFRFAHSMVEGDTVILPVSPTSEIAIGRVFGPYRWVADDSELVKAGYQSVRSVEWLKVVPRTVFSQAALHSFGSFLSVSTSNEYIDEVLAVLKQSDDVPAQPKDAESESEEEAEVPSLFDTAVQETEDYLLKSWQRSGAAFEHVVAAVFEAMGYTATVTQASSDHGVDVVAHPDPLGMERPYIKIQAKSGTGTIGEPQVNQLKGLLNSGEQGVLIALGKFSAQATAAALGSANVTLVGPRRFVTLFLDHYDRLDPAWRAQFPLKAVFVPFSKMR